MLTGCRILAEVTGHVKLSMESPILPATTPNVDLACVVGSGSVETDAMWRRGDLCYIEMKLKEEVLR
jgi:hypothetical protein